MNSIINAFYLWFFFIYIFDVVFFLLFFSDDYSVCIVMVIVCFLF